MQRAGDYARTFSSEDGRHYRGHHQELGPAIRRVQHIRHMHEHATRASNPNGWQHIGSIPPAVLVDWLNKHGYKIDEWARNDGGDPYKTDPHSGGGVKDKFLKYYLSRDFAKLHNRHVTTKAESSQIVVPAHIKRELDSGNNDTPGA